MTLGSLSILLFRPSYSWIVTQPQRDYDDSINNDIPWRCECLRRNDRGPRSDVCKVQRDEVPHNIIGRQEMRIQKRRSTPSPRRCPKPKVQRWSRRKIHRREADMLDRLVRHYLLRSWLQWTRKRQYRGASLLPLRDLLQAVLLVLQPSLVLLESFFQLF